MELSTNKKIWVILLIIFLVITFFVMFLFYFDTLFIIFIVGFVLIIVSEKNLEKFKKLTKNWKINRRFLNSAFICLSILIFILIFYLLIIFTVRDINTTITFMREENLNMRQIYLERAETIFGSEVVEAMKSNRVILSIQEYVINFLINLLSRLSVFIAGGIIIIPLMFLLYFKNNNKIKKNISELIPSKYKDSYTHIIEESSKKLKGYTYAKLLESTIITIICTTGFYIAGLKGWLFFGILCGLLNIIPYLGPWMAAIGPVLISLLEPTRLTFIITVTTLLVAQAVDNFYLIPFLIPKQVKIHPLIGIILIFIGARLYGPLGMLMAIPIYSFYMIVLTKSYYELVKIYDKKLLKKKN